MANEGRTFIEAARRWAESGNEFAGASTDLAIAARNAADQIEREGNADLAGYPEKLRYWADFVEKKSAENRNALLAMDSLIKAIDGRGEED